MHLTIYVMEVKYMFDSFLIPMSCMGVEIWCGNISMSTWKESTNGILLENSLFMHLHSTFLKYTLSVPNYLCKVIRVVSDQG